MNKALCAIVLVVSVAFIESAAAQDPTLIDSHFNPAVTAPGAIVDSIVVQPDGKVLISGADLAQLNDSIHTGVARLNADGTIDANFTAQVDGEVEAMALQSDGKILVAGYLANVNGVARACVARLNVDGTVDTSFSPRGGPTAGADRLSEAANIKAIAVQPDGKIVIGGVFAMFNGATRSSIARLNADGTVDPAFNPSLSGPSDGAVVRSIVVQPDGRVLLGGTFSSVNGVTFSSVVRIDSDGTLDPTFQSSSTGGFNLVTVVLAQGDGKIVVGGFNLGFNNVSRPGLARLNADGSLDVAYHPPLKASGFDSLQVSTLRLQADGKLIAGGHFSTRADGAPNGIARFNSDGTLDSSFDANAHTGDPFSDVLSLGLQNDGQIILGGVFLTVNGADQPSLARVGTNGQLDVAFRPKLLGPGQVYGVVVQPDNKLLIYGYFSNVDTLARTSIARLNADGSLDAGFNAFFDPNAITSLLSICTQPDGKVIYSASQVRSDGSVVYLLGRFNSDGAADAAFHGDIAGGSVLGIHMQPDGKIVITGNFTTVSGAAHGQLARLNSDGSLDTTLAPLTFTPLSYGNGSSAGPTIDDVALQTDGKILVAGQFGTVNGVTHVDLARINPDGTLDESFKASFDFVNSPSPEAPFVEALALQYDGRVIAAGHFDRVGNVARANLARLNADGSPDPSFNLAGPDFADGSFFAIERLALQANGKIVLTGYPPGFLAGRDFRVLRVSAEGNEDNSFSALTRTSLDSAAYPFPVALALQSDGQILVGGFFGSINGTEHVSLARLTGDRVFPGKLLNLSTRMEVLTGDRVLIGGFILTGTMPKKVVLRAIGPSLSKFGITGAIPNPILELHKADGSVVTNDDWKINDATGQSQENDIRATNIVPADDLESAIVQTLSPGLYTAVVRDKNGNAGVGLVEAYDVEQSTASMLANIATRGFIDTGEKVMIGGFIVGPNGGGNAKVVVRGLGPSLAAAGVTGALQDPSIELHDGNGAKIAANDDWMDDAGASEIRAYKLDPSDPRESALLRVLPTGAYTAIVRGVNDAVGVGLVEVYSTQ